MHPPSSLCVVAVVMAVVAMQFMFLPAIADPVDASPGDNGFIVGGGLAEPPAVDPGGGGTSQPASGQDIRYVTYPVCTTGGDPGGSAVCQDRVTCEGSGGPGELVTIDIIYPDGSVEPGGTACSTDGISGDAPVLTPGDIFAAFRRMVLPESVIVVQPPGGETLVNFDTIFSSAVSTESETFSLLGLQVEIEAEPSEFRWVHGDGTEQVTDWPGREFAEGVSMERFISHRYAEAQVTVRPRVDTVWSARFRVDGGAWQPVVGTVEIEGDPSSLRVVEGQPNLVG